MRFSRPRYRRSFVIFPPVRSLLALVVVLAFCCVAHGHHLVKDGPLPKWARNRIFSISKAAPMANYFNRNEKDKQLLLTLTDHYKGREAHMKDLNKNSDYGQDGQYKLCNVVQPTNLEAVGAKTKTLNLGLFRSTCITQLTNPYEESLFKTIMNFGVATRNAGMAASRATVNWSEVYSHANFTYRGPIHRCEVVHTAGFRIKGKWGIITSVTEHPVNLRRKDFDRKYLVEFLVAGRNLSQPISNLLMKLPKWKQNDAIIENTTTSIENWRGIPTGSIFREVMPISEVAAVQAALTKSRQWSEQALDSTTKSNIAIMMFSAALTLVPVALFADVSWLVTFAYALITDIMSCMPLAIKGGELMALSKMSQHASVSWVYGMETATDIGIVETWVANCNSHNSLFFTGLTFLSLAIAAIVVGIVLEVFARIGLQNRKEKYQRVQSTIDSEAGKQLWRKNVVCIDCSCPLDERKVYFHAKV